MGITSLQRSIYPQSATSRLPATDSPQYGGESVAAAGADRQ